MGRTLGDLDGETRDTSGSAGRWRTCVEFPTGMPTLNSRRLVMTIMIPLMLPTRTPTLLETATVLIRTIDVRNGLTEESARPTGGGWEPTVPNPATSVGVVTALRNVPAGRIRDIAPRSSPAL